ncbi:hypothetical protein J6590_086231 [Homalodisca vitripennis]|nr:hypothetical protein J6590_086231 [Homalodisca vitripennis]
MEPQDEIKLLAPLSFNKETTSGPSSARLDTVTVICCGVLNTLWKRRSVEQMRKNMSHQQNTSGF